MTGTTGEHITPDQRLGVFFSDGSCLKLLAKNEISCYNKLSCEF